MEILLALQFLTRIPIPLKHDTPPEGWARSMAWFPAVGLLLGLLLVGGAWLFGHLWPADVVLVLTLVLWVALTGALHLDGAVDSCDALVAAVPPHRRLEILKDVHIGTYGLIGAILLLLVKWLAMGHVPWQGFVLATVLGRWALVYVTWAFPYARPNGLGKLFKDHLGQRELWIAAITTLGMVIALSSWHGLVVGALGWAAAWCVGAWAKRQLGGGITGDICGLACEVVEVVTLLVGGLFL
jgi:adenosylcobinamide-GDP ribazoletransferase